MSSVSQTSRDISLCRNADVLKDTERMKRSVPNIQEGSFGGILYLAIRVHIHTVLRFLLFMEMVDINNIA